MDRLSFAPPGGTLGAQPLLQPPASPPTPPHPPLRTLPPLYCLLLPLVSPLCRGRGLALQTANEELADFLGESSEGESDAGMQGRRKVVKAINRSALAKANANAANGAWCAADDRLLSAFSSRWCATYLPLKRVLLVVNISSQNRSARFVHSAFLPFTRSSFPSSLSFFLEVERPRKSPPPPPSPLSLALHDRRPISSHRINPADATDSDEMPAPRTSRLKRVTAPVKVSR